MFCVCVIYVNGYEVADSRTNFYIHFYLLWNLFLQWKRQQTKCQTKKYPHKLYTIHLATHTKKLDEKKTGWKKFGLQLNKKKREERKQSTVVVIVVVILAAPNESYFRSVQAILERRFFIYVKRYYYHINVSWEGDGDGDGDGEAEWKSERMKE